MVNVKIIVQFALEKKTMNVLFAKILIIIVIKKANALESKINISVQNSVDSTF